MTAGRIRTIKPRFFRSPGTSRLSFEARVLYVAMWCWADDFGIGETNLNGLLGFAFCDTDELADPDTGELRAISAQDVRRFCADIAQAYDVEFYEVRGRYYYSIPSWSDHQKLERRTSRRQNPPPDDPESTPDKRICDLIPSAPKHPRKIGANPCESVLEQGNSGRAEERNSAYAGAADAAADDADEPAAADPPAAAVAVVAETAAETTATLIADWIDHCNTRPPNAVIGQLSKQIKKLLAEGQPYPQVRRAVQAWATKGVNPSALPSVLYEVQNPRQQQRSGGIDWDAAMARAQAADAAEAAQMRDAS